MIYDQLSNQGLHQELKSMKHEEELLLMRILRHLREADRRRLYSDFKRGNLFEYAVKDLGYPEDQAGRRIAAMRLLKELPEIEPKIASGALSLTNLGFAQTLFRKEARAAAKSPKAESTGFSREEKLEILGQLEHQSTRQAQKVVLSHSSDPKALFAESIRPISEDRSELRTTCANKTLEKTERLKGLLAHKHPDLSFEQLLDLLCDLGLKEFDPGLKAKQANNFAAPRSEKTSNPKPAATQPKPTTRYISVLNRREVWRRAQSRCENCGSRRALQVDHVMPFAQGGSSEIENLRLLCRSCNQHAAITAFGQQHMLKYIGG